MFLLTDSGMEFLALYIFFRQDSVHILHHNCVFCCSYREGSIITDFVVQATQVKPTEVAEVNKNIPDAMKSIAIVIGSITAYYNSK